VAAALYVLPTTVLGAIAEANWSWPILAVALAVLGLYAYRTGSALLLLALTVGLGVLEYAILFATALAERCGSSHTAGTVEAVGVGVIMLALGAVGIKRRRLWLLPLSVVAAGVWVVLVSHLITGGSGGCFE
jgi:hypothetical protein